ncbi:DegV family protein [Enterococcus dongliensis]|uniref:DegV family protein n=1 Tax=Enterococcus dongliensis TaxID=2559925 RepID=A0AAP5KTP8_9ENTE|nr:DegV family protein [Enterococcus dongliensis]MDT2595793.1 DegV family protein [Enterococcus dongliensis]MDT2602753.1 DegV family protein [Enterococcus dongliensis]MDT2633759.1 DegV family protein [Enterococcus dongliensis]MDT2636405.1 DegV family protein [Enterococcus dongliensis]MDT2641627.1 DegV family protein [Enterococcus dongliensis]
MKLAIVTDSTAYLNGRTRNHKDLFVIPIPVIIDDQPFEEGVDIGYEEFYQKLKNSKDFPKTSQPVLGEVYDLYRSIKEQGYDTVISIHLSEGISGFVRTLTAIKADIDGLQVIPYDSKITSVPMGYMVEKALEMSDEGKSLNDILLAIDLIRDTTNAYIIVDDLDNLVRGGRLTNGAAIIGGLLKIKPILTFDEGKIVLAEKIRSLKKALQRTEEIIEERHKNDQDLRIFVIHGNNPELAQQEYEKLSQKYPEATIDIGTFGPVIGTHLGDKAIALGVAK